MKYIITVFSLVCAVFTCFTQNCTWQTLDGETWITASDEAWVRTEDCEENAFSVFTLFPNPTVDYFKIVGIEKDTDAIIYNILGQFIQKVNINKEVDVSQFSQGIYFICFKKLKLKFIKL